MWLDDPSKELTADDAMALFRLGGEMLAVWERGTFAACRPA